MRVLLISPAGFGHRIAGFSADLAWNLTCVDNVEEALEFTLKTEFQAVFVATGDKPSAGLHTITCLANCAQSAPIIHCSEADDPYQRIRALELGALTCVQLPSSRDEIEMVVRAIVRHTNALGSNIIKVGGVVLDLVEKRFQADGNAMLLSLREYQLLELLFLNKGRLVTREKIMNHLYDHEEEPHQKIIDVLVCKIRQRLRIILGDLDLIKTVWGLGYRVEDQPSWESLGTFSSLRAA